jgi:hypothetical protein
MAAKDPITVLRCRANCDASCGASGYSWWVRRLASSADKRGNDLLDDVVIGVGDRVVFELCRDTSNRQKWRLERRKGG